MEGWIEAGKDEEREILKEGWREGGTVSCCAHMVCLLSTAWSLGAAAHSLHPL